MSKLRRLAKSKRFRIGLLIFVVLAAGFGGWRYIESWQAARAEKQRSEYQTLTKQVNEFVWKKNYDRAVTILQDYIASAPSEQFKYDATTQLGAVYINAAKYEDAITTLQAADQLNVANKLAVAEGIAISAEALGNKSLAIESYRRAITLIQARPAGLNFDQANIRYYEDKIKQLEAQL